jgi:formylglycine-generating enzyme required for sulfatase activity/proteasome lid subunit RPN8/RPN11
MRLPLEPGRVAISAELLKRLSDTVLERLPRKSFGYLLSPADSPEANDFVMFEDNARNSVDWQDHFHAYGRYFVEHDDAGFVATPEESWRVQQEIWSKRAVEVGMFHSHLRHPANFSGVDYDMHTQRFENLWHLIVSMRNPEHPQLRVFAVTRNDVREMICRPLIPDAAEQTAFPFDWQRGLGSGGRASVLASGHFKDSAILEARDWLSLAPDGTPRCKDNEAITRCVGALLNIGDADAIDQFVTRGFLRGSTARYAEFIAPKMRELGGGTFQMGSDLADRRHFVGEVPRHAVNLAPFAIAQTAVTHRLYSLFDRSLPMDGDSAKRPVTDVSWFDATVFALWMGCRLPSEAEWEFACHGGTQSEWACGDERTLPRFGWFSENSSGRLRDVGLLEPNAYGLYDLHGNVWEWCFDGYDEHYYGKAPAVDPVCLASPHGRRSCRGGSVRSLAEMCRTRYRLSEPATFRAGDLGFRVAAGPPPHGFKEQPA